MGEQNITVNAILDGRISIETKPKKSELKPQIEADVGIFGLTSAIDEPSTKKSRFETPGQSIIEQKSNNYKNIEKFSQPPQEFRMKNMTVHSPAKPKVEDIEESMKEDVQEASGSENYSEDYSEV